MVLNVFKQIVENPHDYAKKWKATHGGKIFGCICGNVPEELLYAAGILPVRIIADPKVTPILASDHIQANRCASCRGNLELGLNGQYDYIDGLIHVQSCLSQSLAFSSWVLHHPPVYYYKMFRPFRHTEAARKVYTDFLLEFKYSLEQWIGLPISEKSLKEAVDIYRENRKLMKQVYDLRKNHPPIIKGSDALIIVLASMVMDKKEHNNLLRQLLKEIPEMRPCGNGSIRTMIVGSGMSPLDFIEFLEQEKIDVVIEDHCLGLRYFWGDNAVDEDPMVAIVKYYYDNKPQCAYQDWTGEGTQNRLIQLADEFDVEAVIWLAQAFCGTYQWEIPDAIAIFENKGIPILKLERGRSIPRERLHNKIENFFSKVKIK